MCTISEGLAMLRFVGVVAFAVVVNGVFVGQAGAEPFIYAVDDPLGKVYVIDSATDHLVDTITLPPPEPGGYPDQGDPQPSLANITVSKDGKYLIIPQANRRDVYLVNLDKRRIRYRRAHTAAHVSLSPDGTTAFLTSRQGFVSIIRQREDVRRTYVPGAKASLTSVDGSSLYTLAEVSGTAFLRVTRLADLAEIVDIPTCGSTAMAITPDGHYMYVACYAADAVQVVDLQLRMVVDTLVGFGSPVNIVINATGTEAYILNQTPRRVVEVRLPTNQKVRNIVVTHGGLSGLAITPDGSKLYVSHPFAHEIEVLDTHIGESIGTIGLGSGYPLGMAASPAPSPFE